MILETIVVGMLQVNCYLIGDGTTNKGIIVDPGDEPDRIMDYVDRTGLKVVQLLCTHGHFDHIGAVGELRDALGAQILLHRDDLIVYQHSYEVAREWGLDAEPQPEPDLLIDEGYSIELGASRLSVIHTPGHSPGGICLIGTDFVLTGDTIFAGSIGRTDFPGGDYNAIGRSFRRIMGLGDTIRLLPGHGPASTIGYERVYNPFCSEFLR
jgi:glyoxylase-like metal-dependent hydrolase (beta-lactamase superfamily II)